MELSTYVNTRSHSLSLISLFPSLSLNTFMGNLCREPVHEILRLKVAHLARNSMAIQINWLHTVTRTWLNGQVVLRRYHILYEVEHISVSVCVEHTSPELSINWEHFVHMQRQCWQCQLSALLMTCNKCRTVHWECTTKQYPVDIWDSVY